MLTERIKTLIMHEETSKKAINTHCKLLGISLILRETSFNSIQSRIKRNRIKIPQNKDIRKYCIWITKKHFILS